ncbi:MAG: hypothetical protein D6795_02515, partial [Deltaproteobacteria bacterium]
RYYNPQWGRYLSPDPLPSLQPFAYAKNNPVKFVDPSGLFWDYVADGVGLGYDIYVIKTEGASFGNVATLAFDVVLAAARSFPASAASRLSGKLLPMAMRSSNSGKLPLMAMRSSKVRKKLPQEGEGMR